MKSLAAQRWIAHRRSIFAPGASVSIWLLSAILVLGLMPAEPVQGQDGSQPPREWPHASDHILVKLEPDSSAGAVGRGARPVFDRWLRVPVPRGKSPDQAVEDFAARPGVEAATLDHLIRLDPQPAMAVSSPAASSIPNDEFYSYQWHFPAVQLEEAWVEASGTGVVVAVVDTGVSPDGEDGFANSFTSPYNAISDTSGASAARDDNGHGTHVAGTVSQHTHNGVGVAGVAFDAALMPIKALRANGQGTASEIARGIDWARSHGADIINLSLGIRCVNAGWPTCSSPVLNDAVEAAVDEGVVIVAAAGNQGDGVVAHPANHPEVIAVGAVDYNLELTDYSNTGSSLDLVAPGGDNSVDENGDGQPDGILQETFTSAGWNYYFFEGTSMAAPHVAGASALLLSGAPCATPPELREALVATARDLGASGFDTTYGHGLVQISDAVASLRNPDTSPPCWPPGASLGVRHSSRSDISMTWPKARDNGSIAGYRIFVDGTRIETVDAQTTSTTVEGLDPATHHQLAVRPVDSVGNVGPALSATVRTLDGIPPFWPDGAELEVARYGETELALAWSLAHDNVGVTAYRLEAVGSAGTTTQERQATVSGLAAGSEHAFEVRAQDAEGNWSEPLTAVVRTARAFLDTADSVFYEDILWLSGNDITRGCNPPANDRYCPDESVTRGQMAAFLVRALSLQASVEDPFRDDDASVFEGDIATLAASGITRGCNPPVNDRFCPDEPVTRGQMAAFLARALQLPAAAADTFADDDSSVFQADIEALAASGITRGCNPPVNDRFCPDDPVTRGQMAAFLARALADRPG